jgi:hypothetical protein
MHHDIEYIEETGTILALVWEVYSGDDAETAGRTSYGSTIWTERVIEIQPDIENGTAEIIWEWNVWDHLVQDENASAENYGVVADHPELVNLNFTYSDATSADWLHMNAVDYNADLDQILISSRNFSEFWIIDHSTTTEEAASHEGGTYGKGGDLLYRWGNPQTYDQGDDSDQMLFVQHNANWIDEDYADGGSIMVFNNQAGNAYDEDYSSVDVIDTGVNEDGSYDLDGEIFGPSSATWSYIADEPTDFYAENISGANRLPNGNTLINEGTTGTIFEVTYYGDIVWEYINPISSTGTLTQGSTASNNRLFRALRYSTDYVGLEDYDLTPDGTIEYSSSYSCDLYSD